MEKEKINELKAKLRKIGKDSLALISKYKHGSLDNDEMYDIAIKINSLAHEIYDCLDRES